MQSTQTAESPSTQTAGSSPLRASARVRPRLSRRTGFWAIAFSFLAVAAFSTAPSSLYGLYEQQEHLSSLTITIVYAVYAVGVIAGCSSLLHPVASNFILPRPNDGRVSVQSCMLTGMADHTVVKASHTALPFNRLAIRQTIAFLQDGRFQDSAAA